MDCGSSGRGFKSHRSSSLTKTLQIHWRVKLAGPVLTPGKRDQERQHLAKRQRRLARQLALAHLQQAAVRDGLTALADIVDSTDQYAERWAKVPKILTLLGPHEAAWRVRR